MQPVVRSIDHILIEASDPAALFDLFSAAFRLPVAWPLQSFGPFTSGAVHAGNVNLEFIRFDTSRFGKPIDSWSRVEGARLIGLAFEPAGSSADALEELDRCGIGHGNPRVTPHWTNTQILGLLDEPGALFLHELHVDNRQWRASLSQQLTASQGGELGLVRIAQVRIETNVPADWRRFLGVSGEPSAIPFEAGPSLLLREGVKNRLLEIRGEVTSLSQARTALAKRGMVSEESGASLRLLPSAIGGFAIDLVE